MMNKKSIRIQVILAVAAVLVVAAPQAGAGMALKFFGTAQANELSPPIEQAMAQSRVDVEGFNCFELPLVDLASGRRVGIGVDCLNVFNDLGDINGAGLQIEAKTFFFLRRGLIVNHGCTSVRPFFTGVGDAGATHITGSIPPSEFGVEPSPIFECEEAEGVILATRGFRRSEGDVRLSGAVNLSNAGAGEITFSCIFALDFDAVRPWRPHGDDDESSD
jgi:hypothetical protein